MSIEGEDDADEPAQKRKPRGKENQEETAGDKTKRR